MLDLHVDEPAQADGSDGDVLRHGSHRIEAPGVARILFQAELADDRLDERTALQVFVLGLQVVLLAAIDGEHIFDVENIVRLAVNLDAGGGLVDTPGVEEINQAEGEHGAERGNGQPAPFQDDVPVMPKVYLFLAQNRAGRFCEPIFHKNQKNVS